MDKETLKVLPLAAVGALCGVFEYYVKPIPSDMFKWITGQLLQFDMPSQEELDAHLEQVSQEYP